jgi:TonB family protein
MRSAGGEDPGLRQRAAAKTPWIIALSLASLAWLAISAGGNETRESGSEYQSIERRVCGATHVVVGTARDFEVVREADCIAYDDRRPYEGAGVLGRCESLQFKVDVLDQVWPLPDPGQRVASVRTFRQGRVRADAEKLRYDFSVGWYDGRVGAPGPHVFYGRASIEDGATILRNSWREGVFSTPVLRDRPRYVDSPIARCGPRYKLAEDVRMACPWDYAFVGTAKSFRRAPPGRRLPDLPVYAEARSPVHPSLEDRTILEAGDAVEVELEVIENFDAMRPAPKGRQFFMRLPVAERTELGQVRAAWSDEKGAPLRSVFFMLEARNEPGLLDGSRKWDEHYMLFPAWKYDFHGEEGPSRSARQRLHACNMARAAFTGKEPPVLEKDPPRASERYLEIWQDRADKALAKVCATRSLDERSVTIGIYIVPDGNISRVAIERASKDARFDQRVVDALKTVEQLPPFPAPLRKTAGMHLSRSIAPVEGWCWGR